VVAHIEKLFYILASENLPGSFRKLPECGNKAVLRRKMIEKCEKEII
jgi:hypothetical protein